MNRLLKTSNEKMSGKEKDNRNNKEARYTCSWQEEEVGCTTKNLTTERGENMINTEHTKIN